MVLQRMQYDVINGEEEDVTPVDGSISKAASRPAKVTIILLLLLSSCTNNDHVIGYSCHWWWLFSFSNNNYFI